MLSPYVALIQDSIGSQRAKLWESKGTRGNGAEITALVKRTLKAPPIPTPKTHFGRGTAFFFFFFFFFFKESTSKDKNWPENKETVQTISICRLHSIALKSTLLLQIWTSKDAARVVRILSVKSKEGWFVTYLIPLPHFSSLFTMSLPKAARHKMAALMSCFRDFHTSIWSWSGCDTSMDLIVGIDATGGERTCKSDGALGDDPLLEVLKFLTSRTRNRIERGRKQLCLNLRRKI